ncbi:hypothetical protein HOLleu_13145 [Holothuria leucospilota]|uniref:Uncharacterized protein n=1 Tax=Holothuria leucospilota TaxID=206669 RepID=A0A9Q1CC36_HOLLE|nr:hypothetical protein HOLleu_13145 [Holothuria leucospilota]
MESLRQHLKKVFTSVHQELKIWKECLDSSQPLWESLVNTTEQYHCCQRAEKDHSDVIIFKEFPDATERLQVKLISSLNIVTGKLQKKMMQLDKVSKAVHNEWQSSWQLLSQQSRHVNVEETVRASATEPSVSDMLMWLRRINLLLQQDYAERNWMLESANFEKEDLINHYHSAWISKQKNIQLEIDSKSWFEACKQCLHTFNSLWTRDDEE